MTAGTRPSRRTERAAPLPVPLRVTAASCLIAAMMMSLLQFIAPCLPGCRIAREARAYREGERSEQVQRLAFAVACSQMLSFGVRDIMTSASVTHENWRIEKDALGEVKVPTAHLWGAQTERSRLNFVIGVERHRWGRPVIRAFGLLKKCAALANLELGQLPKEKVDLIVRAAEDVIEGKLDQEFPLVVFQTGSGTQSNMNANEVIANRAIQIVGGVIGSKKPIHPNDDVNHSQSSNDVFPTIMHIARAERIRAALLPPVAQLRDTLDAKAKAFSNIVMVGRTHLQDATPLTLGQAISGWAAQLDQAIAGIERACQGLMPLAIGGTAVGTGLNAHPRFGDTVARILAEETGEPFTSARNKFAALSSGDAVVDFCAALRHTAGACMKIANDI